MKGTVMKNQKGPTKGAKLLGKKAAKFGLGYK